MWSVSSADLWPSRIPYICYSLSEGAVSAIVWVQDRLGRATQWRPSERVNDLQAGQPLSIPKSYFDGVHSEVKSYSLYGFCDASLSAYAAVVYLVVQTDVGRFVKFTASKTRVAPIQGHTVPRLELLSAFLLARLVSNVSDCLAPQLSLGPMKLFTDSRVALFWIRSDKEWKQFVQNRVNEIRNLTPAKYWGHCPGKDNPADVPSRASTPLELSVNVLFEKWPQVAKPWCRWLWLRYSGDAKRMHIRNVKCWSKAHSQLIEYWLSHWPQADNEIWRLQLTLQITMSYSLCSEVCETAKGEKVCD